MVIDSLRFTYGLCLFPSPVGVVAQQFLLLGVHRDHRFTSDEVFLDDTG